jgi:hypothetical protein
VKGGEDVPQDAAWLTEWQRRTGYGDSEAAMALEMGLSTFRNQRSGRSKVSPRTARLAMYAALHRIDWLDIAELSIKLAAALEQRRNGRARRRKKLPNRSDQAEKHSS